MMIMMNDNAGDDYASDGDAADLVMSWRVLRLRMRVGAPDLLHGSPQLLTHPRLSIQHHRQLPPFHVQRNDFTRNQASKRLGTIHPVESSSSSSSSSSEQSAYCQPPLMMHGKRLGTATAQAQGCRANEPNLVPHLNRCAPPSFIIIIITIIHHHHQQQQQQQHLIIISSSSSSHHHHHHHHHHSSSSSPSPTCNSCLAGPPPPSPSASPRLSGGVVVVVAERGWGSCRWGGGGGGGGGRYSNASTSLIPACSWS
jgi:hypothetical protein